MIPSYTPNGYPVTWKCDECGCAVAVDCRDLHARWHGRVLLAPASTSICYCPDRGDDYHLTGDPGCRVTPPEGSGE